MVFVVYVRWVICVYLHNDNLQSCQQSADTVGTVFRRAGCVHTRVKMSTTNRSALRLPNKCNVHWTYMCAHSAAISRYLLIESRNQHFMLIFSLWHFFFLSVRLMENTLITNTISLYIPYPYWSI